MKSYDISRLLLLLFLCSSDSVHGLCSLKKQTAAECADLEDARYIDTYQLHSLRASSAAETLAPGNFRNLTSLRHLDLSTGNIETIETGSFAKLGSLMTLNLADNHIAHLEAGAFDGLKHLRNLKLSDNKIRQLPSALMTLKELKYLDVSDNPLNCNCASMKLRDALLTRGVKISKRTRCMEPISSKGLSLLKPDTKTTCVFESQDLEMQRDQPAEDRVDGSGDEDVDKILDDDFAGEEKEVEQPPEVTEEETPLPPVSSETPSTEAETPSPPASSETPSTEAETPSPPASSETSSTEAETPSPPVSSEIPSTEAETPSPSVSSEIPSTEAETPSPSTLSESASTDGESSSPSTSSESSSTTTTILTTLAETTPTEVSSSTAETTSEKDDEVDLDAGEAEKKDTSTQGSSTQDITEGSGETDDEGSGEPDDEGSGLLDVVPKIISPVNVDEINFNDTLERVSEDSSSISPTTSATTTTTDGGWWAVVDLLNPFGSSETTTTLPPPTTEKNPEEQARDEQFIPTATEPPQDVNEKVAVPVETSKNVDQPPTGDNPPGGNAVVEAADSAPSQEPQKGSGSYYVLATLLAILAILIAFAAYKGDFCRKKRKRRDVERGTEMKDMQKSLLEQNAAQSKVQVSNGNTMENVPLMNSTSTPGEPKDNQKSYDISTAPATTNGANKPIGWAVDDPVKPPRKSYGQEIEAPLNGLNPPMDDIDGPTTIHSGSDDALTNGDYNGDVPPLSPGAQRVKITMGELPESVPKTPILITRLKNGDNLVKTP